MTRIKSVFGDYATQLQVLVNENLEKFKDPFFPKYFTTGIPKSTLSYATAIGRSRIEAAASVVAHGSEAPLRSRAGLEKLSGEVAAIKVKREMEENEYRNWLTLRETRMADESKKQQIIQLIWNDVKHVVDAVNSRLDIMAKQALSRGIVTINATTNPDGIVVGDVDLLVTNRDGLNINDHTAASGHWTHPIQGNNTGATATPIEDIIQIVSTAEDNGIAFEKMLMTPSKWREVASIVSRAGGRFDEEPTLDEMNNYLTDRNLPYIELVTGRHSLETDGGISNYVAWQNQYVTFIPAGSLGVIHNALAIEEISPVQGVDYAMNDRVLVSKWAQTEPFGEYTRGEIAAFPGLEAADNVWMLNTESVTWA